MYAPLSLCCRRRIVGSYVHDGCPRASPSLDGAAPAAHGKRAQLCIAGLKRCHTAAQTLQRPHSSRWTAARHNVFPSGGSERRSKWSRRASSDRCATTRDCRGANLLILAVSRCQVHRASVQLPTQFQTIRMQNSVIKQELQNSIIKHEQMAPVQQQASSLCDCRLPAFANAH